MNNEIKNAITEAAKNTGLSHQAVLDQAVTILNIKIITRLRSPENAQFTLHIADTSYFNMDRSMSTETLMEIAVVARCILNAINESAPFEDVIAQYYEDEFLDAPQAHDWLLTPDLVTKTVADFKRDIKRKPLESCFIDTGCRTGLQTLSFLKQIIHACGKNKMLNRIVFMSEPNPALLKIAIFQIMVNCLRCDMRIENLSAYNFDFHNKNLRGGDNHRIFAVAGKTGAARKAALKASADATLADNTATSEAA